MKIVRNEVYQGVDVDLVIDVVDSAGNTKDLTGGSAVACLTKYGVIQEEIPVEYIAIDGSEITISLPNSFTANLSEGDWVLEVRATDISSRQSVVSRAYITILYSETI